MSKMKIRNTIGHSVVLMVPDLHLRREIQPNETINIDSDKFEEAMTYPGVKNLFRYGYLRIENAPEEIEEAMEDAGLTPEEIKGFLSMKELVDLFTNQPIDVITETLVDYPKERYDSILEAMDQVENLEFSKVNAVKKAFGIDYLSYRTKKQKLEE